jgi:hypothetical protein
MHHDEVLREVWAIKDAIARKFGEDVHAMTQDALATQAYWESRGFRFVSPLATNTEQPPRKSAKKRPAFRGRTNNLRKH